MAYEDTDDAKNLISAAKREKKDYERGQMSDEPGATESLRSAAARMGADKPKSKTYGGFKEAFAAARKSGEKTFTFNGKKYTTKLKEEGSKPAPKAAKAAPKGYMSKMNDDDRAYRAPKMGDQDGFMAKRMSPSEAANARTSADYKGKSAKEMGMGSRMDPMQAATAGISEEEKVGTYKRGGKVKKEKKMDENMMMGREGRNMAKAGMQKKMKSGGIASSLKAHAAAPASKAHAMKSGGMAKYAKGGKVDGCARKGKTKGRMV